MCKNNQALIQKAAERMKNGTLSIEEILDDEDLVNDLKSPSFSQLISFLSNDKMEKLLDFILKEPHKDSDIKSGYKFPYFACEILCSENVFLIEKYFEDSNKAEETKEGDDQSLDHHEDLEERKQKESPNRTIEVNISPTKNESHEEKNHEGQVTLDEQSQEQTQHEQNHTSKGEKDEEGKYYI